MHPVHTPLNRRALLLGLATAPVTFGWPEARATPRPGYTAKTAPDALGRSILVARIPRLQHGAAPGTDPTQAIQANAQQIIEQNFAAMDSTLAGAFLATLEPGELDMIARAYANATANSGRAPRALDLLAVRCSGRQLGAVSQAFGFGPAYEALLRSAPSKALEFTQHANPNSMAPAPGSGARNLPMSGSASMRPLVLRDGGGGRMIKTAPNDFMTLEQIWAEFRSAAMGSLSPRAALWSTMAYGATMLNLAWIGGQNFGTNYAAPFIQNNLPTLWIGIGALTYYVVDQLSITPEPNQQAPIENALGQSAAINVPATLRVLGAMTGGDYEELAALRDAAASGGGGAGGGGSGGGGPICYLQCAKV